MNEYSAFGEQEIDFWDFLKSMLEQWRGWLLLGLVGMLLFPALKYFKDLKIYNEYSNESVNISDSSETANEYTAMSMEGIVSRANVSVALNYYISWRILNDSYNDSLIIQLDANNVRTLFLDYYIDCDEESNIIYVYYSDLMLKDGFVDMLSEAFGKKDINPGYVLEMVDVTADGSAINHGGAIRIKVFLPDGTDEKKVQASISEYLNNYSLKISETVGEHDISLVTSNVINVYDATVLAYQGNTLTNIFNWRNNFVNMYKNLSDEEKEELNDILIQLDRGVLSYSDIRKLYPTESKLADDFEVPAGEVNSLFIGENTGVVNLNPPTFNYKFAILGLVVFIILYNGCMLLYLIVFKRYRNGEEVSTSLSIRSYGDIYSYPYHGFKAFIHDRRIYTWRHKNSSNIESVAGAICTKASFESISKLTCLILGENSILGKEMMDEIAKKVSNLGVEMELKTIPNGLASLSEDEITKLSPVLLTIISGTTRPIQVANLLARLKEYKIRVLGMNFVEI